MIGPVFYFPRFRVEFDIFILNTIISYAVYFIIFDEGGEFISESAIHWKIGMHGDKAKGSGGKCFWINVTQKLEKQYSTKHPKTE